jgi:hypothetical protein
MAQGSRGHVGIKKEVEWGTWVPGASNFHLPFVSENLTTNIEELLSAAQRGILDEPKSYQGERSFGGDLILEVHPGSIGHILRSALNVPEDAVAADTTETELDKCDAKWVGHESIISEIDTTDKKKGSAAIKLSVPAGVAPSTTILATKDFDAINMASVTDIKFWIKSSIAMIKADLKIIVSEYPACVEDTGKSHREEEISILVENTWTEVTVPLTAMTEYNEVISIGIRLINDKAEFVLRADDVRMVVTGSAAHAMKHIFIPRQATDFDVDCPINPYTLEVYRDQGNPFQFLGSIVNTLALNFSTTDKILKATCGIIAKEVGDTPKLTLALETTKPFVWENAKIKINAVGEGDPINADIESFGITWDNLCIAKYALNNSAKPRKIIRNGVRTIPVSFVIDFVNRDEYAYFLSGQERAFQIRFVGAKVHVSEDDTPFSLQIDMPLVRYLTYPINMPGSGRLTCAVTGKAKYHADGWALKSTLINLETGY